MSMLPLDSTNNVASEMFRKFGLNAQATYNPIIRDTFYALVPSNFKFYYMNAIRRSLHWYQGYVPEVHDPSMGIPSTCIGTSIVEKLTKLVISGEVFFENKYAEKTNNKGESQSSLRKDLAPVNATLETFNKWSIKYTFQNFIKTLVEYAVAGGTSAGVAYVNNDSELFLKPYRIDQFFYNVGFSGQVDSYTGFIAFYTAKVDNGTGRKETDCNFYLLEERYYGEDGKPKMKYAIKRQVGNVSTGMGFDVRQTSDMKWEQLPTTIQKHLKRDFQGIKFGVEQNIEFTNDLGVYLLRWTLKNRIPEVHMGEPALLNVVSYLQVYEFAEASLWTDLYLGRGKILMPEEMRNPTEALQSYYSGYDAAMFTKMPLRNANEQKPMSIQFEIRAEEHAKNRNNISEKIAATIGVSGSELFSYLRDISGSSKTATQIAEESKITNSFVEEKRSIIRLALQPFIELWREYYKQADYVTMRFSTQNMVNKLVTLEESRVKRELGYSKYDIFREQNPDKDEKQISEMVRRAYEEQEYLLSMKTKIETEAMKSALDEQQKEKPNEEEGNAEEVEMKE
jgi:hypothetical protein